MGDQLEDAKIQSEPPHQGNDHMVQQATSNASKLAVFGPAVSAFGGVIGAVQGHQQDEEERQRAHQRMVNVVADLAADYDRNAAVSFSTDLPSPPAELPGGIESTVPPSALANIVAAIRALGLFGSGGGTATLQQATGTTHVDAQAGPDSHPTDAHAGPVDTGTALVGASDPGHPHHGGFNISTGELLVGGGGLALGVGLAARSAMSSGGGAGTTGAAGANIPARPNPAADPVLGREHDPNAAQPAGTWWPARPAESPAAAAPTARPRSTRPGSPRTTWTGARTTRQQPILGDGRPRQAPTPAATTSRRAGARPRSSRPVKLRWTARGAVVLAVAGTLATGVPLAVDAMPAFAACAPVPNTNATPLSGVPVAADPAAAGDRVAVEPRAGTRSSPSSTTASPRSTRSWPGRCCPAPTCSTPAATATATTTGTARSSPR